MSHMIDLTGQRFGQLTVLARSPRRDIHGRAYWVCRCDCGKEKVVRGDRLRGGTIESCSHSKEALQLPGAHDSNRDVGSRLKAVRSELGVTQKTMAKRLGVTFGLISGVERGRFGLTDNMADALCSTWPINKEWLLNGRGDMFTQKVGIPSFNGEMVQLLRKKLGLSKRSFARQIGYSDKPVWMVECGRCALSARMLTKIREVFTEEIMDLQRKDGST